jgi:hypothetical protein
MNSPKQDSNIEIVKSELDKTFDDAKDELNSLLKEAEDLAQQILASNLGKH